jgi:signal transduction histidine kinase
VATAGAQARPTRVLVLYQQQAETQPMLEFSKALQSSLRKELASPVEFYQEALDLDRFIGREHSSPLAHYLDDKYGGFGVDVIVPVGHRALNFAVDQLSDVLPKVPIVFALCAAPQVEPSALPANVTGRLAAASRFVPTLDMARALQPDAERVVVVGGAGSSDSAAVAAAMSAAAVMVKPLPVTALRGVRLDTLLRTLRQLPRRSIVVFANYRIDGHGQAFEPLDIIGSVAHASAAPMYTQLRSYVGEGVVGGSVTRFDDEGIRTGQLVARVLARRAGEPMPAVESIANLFVVDWRQLRRWKLSEALLPPGTEVLFRDQTIWQRYWLIVLVAAAVIGAEMLLIARLLLERRRRIRAQRVLEAQQRRAEETRRQVAHMGRVALVGELAATISHELRQPLAAIRANAEAGDLLLASAPSESSEAREIFRTIVDDDARAVDVIESVRKLLRKDEPTVSTVDLNQICRESVRLLQHEAVLRNTRLELSVAGEALVTGDPIQLEQVVLNLVINALDAVATSTSERSVVVQTDRWNTEIELDVLDTGPGIPPSVQPRLFESFFSTKPSGLGLGLVIARSIIQRHGGRIQAENRESGGAVFRVRLPGSTPADSQAPESDRVARSSRSLPMGARDGVGVERQSTNRSR